MTDVTRHEPAGLATAAGESLPWIDPDLRAAALTRPSFAFTRESLPRIRAASVPLQPLLPPPAPQPEERSIEGEPGSPPVRIVIVAPAGSGGGRPALLHMHGGGYVIGAATRARSRRLQLIAERHGCVVVSVDYRLAPETPHPGPLNDNYAALRWLHAHADELGVDRRRIAVGGESAGGGHAAALAIAARDRGEFAICFQLLTYPMLDDRTGITRAVPAHIGTIGWSRESNRFGWSALLGVPAGSDMVPAGAVPARVANLAGLPPAYIGVGAIDVLVQEDIAYAERLLAAGVPTELAVMPGAFHGFDVFAPEAAVTRAFTEGWNLALARGFRVG